MIPSDVVIGCCSGQNFAAIRRFAASLFHVCPNASLHLFVLNPDNQIHNLADGLDITLHDAAPYARKQRLEEVRYSIFLQFLKARETHVGRALITDVEDVFFQADPFGQPLPSSCIFAVEAKRFSECSTNSSWFRRLYGQQALDTITDYVISCAGTTLGSFSGLLVYLEAMCQQIEGHIEPIDQAIHNYVVHKLLRDSYLDNDMRFFSTLGQAPDEAIEIVNSEVMLSKRLSPVVHQYDVKPRVFSIFNSVKFQLPLDRGLCDALSDRELLMRFESLGTNCDFGLVQRAAGAETLGLFQFIGVDRSLAKRAARNARRGYNGRISWNWRCSQHSSRIRSCRGVYVLAAEARALWPYWLLQSAGTAGGGGTCTIEATAISPKNCSAI